MKGSRAEGWGIESSLLEPDRTYSQIVSKLVTSRDKRIRERHIKLHLHHADQLPDLGQWRLRLGRHLVCLLPYTWCVSKKRG